MTSKWKRDEQCTERVCVCVSWRERWGERALQDDRTQSKQGREGGGEGEAPGYSHTLFISKNAKSHTQAVWGRDAIKQNRIGPEPLRPIPPLERHRRHHLLVYSLSEMRTKLNRNSQRE